MARMTKSLILTLILLVSLRAQSQSVGAEQLLVQDLNSAIKTLPMEVRIYHYFNVPQVFDQLQSPAGRSEYSRLYFQAVGSRFWDLNYMSDSFINAGPGIYSAIDPLISQEYGNTMLEITLSAGTKYLNVVKQLSIRAETLSALVAEGIVDSNTSSILFGSVTSPKFSRDTLKNMTSLQHVAFRQLVQKIFFDGGISVIEYNWDTDLPRQICPRHGYSAFVLVGRPQMLGDLQSITDSAKMILSAPSLNLRDLTQEELDSQNRAQSFRGLLAEVKSKKLLGVKLDTEVVKSLVSNFFVDQVSYLDTLYKTFSCQETGSQ